MSAGDTGQPMGDRAPDSAQVPCGERAAEVEARIDEMLPQLSLRDAVSLMHGASIFATDGVWAAAVDSLRAGLDVEMPTGAHFAGFANAVDEGRQGRPSAATRRGRRGHD